VWRRLRWSGRARLDLHADDRRFWPAELLDGRLEPRTLLFEHVLDGALPGTKGERQPIARRLDPLRLRHDRVVEDRLRILDFGEQRILERRLSRRSERLGRRLMARAPARGRRWSRRSRRYPRWRDGS